MTLESRLAAASNDAERGRILRDAGEKPAAALVYRLCDESRRLMRVNVADAANYADAASTVARRARDPRATAEALRMRGHVCYLAGKHRQAAAAYRSAVALLDQLGELIDAARTMSSALQTLIYLGQYAEAEDWARRARKIFRREGDHLRLARLDSNAGNILHRQDRYEEAIELYRRAIDGLHQCGDRESAAIAQRNMAVCYMAVHDFERALEAYEEARHHYAQNGLGLLAAEVNDNIAYLYHLRGDYTRALALYQSSGVEERGNTYHAAVSKLDQSDLYLELNLFTEAAALAEDAAERFGRLGMRYERAKSLLNVGLSFFRLGDPGRALPLLARARRWFRGENNPGWTATTDLYRAAILVEMGDLDEGRRAALAAQQVLDSSSLRGKAILCALLLARIELLAGRPAEAGRYRVQAARHARSAGTAALGVHLHTISAQIAEAHGDAFKAWTEYGKARRLLEMLRGRLSQDQQRIAFLKDKQALYESLVHLAIEGAVETGIDEVLSYVEQAKSRSLAESIALHSGRNRTTSIGQFSETAAIRDLRRDLASYYHQLDRAEASKDGPALNRVRQLRQRIVHCENRLAAELTISRPAAPDRAPTGVEAGASLESIQGAIPAGTALLEYFTARGCLYLFAITRKDVRTFRLGPEDEARRAIRLLDFQLSKGSAGGLWPESASADWLAATQVHLRNLYRLLIEPARRWLPDGHWVVVPHGALHRFPFHALHDGETYLIDQRTFSFAPSATVYSLCRHRRPAWEDDAVVFGVSDERAPDIRREVEAVAGLLPGARLFVGPEATSERLRDTAVRSRFVHLATHGVFRRDNPMFSSIRLANARVSVLDLYDFRFAAELVTLSGCATGLNQTVGAGEVIGLARGLLYAGAHAVQLTLWEVNDRSTADYMVLFYERLRSGRSLSAALREAMIEVRERYPHPYHWAPFALTGHAGKTRRYSISGVPSQP